MTMLPADNLARIKKAIQFAIKDASTLIALSPEELTGLGIVSDDTIYTLSLLQDLLDDLQCARKRIVQLEEAKVPLPERVEVRVGTRENLSQEVEGHVPRSANNNPVSISPS